MNKNIPTIVVLLISAIFLIFYNYHLIPKGLTHDENELARAAFSIENKPYTPFTPVADGHGTPYFYSLLFSFKVFGVNQFALRLPSRIFGVLIILFFYLLVNKIIKKDARTSLILSFILLTSRWYLHFVRVAFETPFLLLLEIISLYFAVNYLENKQKKYIILSGIFAGLAFNSYQPGRIFFLVPFVILFYVKSNWKIIAYYLFAFIIFILPISISLLKNPQNDIRINQQFFLKNSQLTFNKKFDYLSTNIQKTVLMFAVSGDINGQHNYTGKPALNPILSVLFFTGLLITVVRWKKFGNFIFLSYFIVSLIPTILTYPWENPNMLRTYTCLPSVAYFAGQIIVFVKNSLTKKKYHPYLLMIIYFLLAVSSFYELRTYFKYQPLVFKQSFDKPDYLKIIRQNTLKLINQ